MDMKKFPKMSNTMSKANLSPVSKFLIGSALYEYVRDKIKGNSYEYHLDDTPTKESKSVIVAYAVLATTLIGGIVYSKLEDRSCDD